jgi:sugar (pentulose or hexulose) kinase
MTDLLLGIDVGTSACKAAVVDLDGVELAHGQVPTPWDAVPTGAQVDPDALFAAAADAANQAIDNAPEGRIAAIGVTSMA